MGGYFIQSGPLTTVVLAVEQLHLADTKTHTKRVNKVIVWLFWFMLNSQENQRSLTCKSGEAPFSTRFKSGCHLSLVSLSQRLAPAARVRQRLSEAF
jgi:hypothetical protein